MSYVKQTVNTVADNYILQRLAIETCEGDVDSSQHVLTLFALACSLRAKSVLELGVRHGFTTLPLLAAMCITDGHLTSVDLDQPKVLHPEWELKDFMLAHCPIQKVATSGPICCIVSYIASPAVTEPPGLLS